MNIILAVVDAVVAIVLIVLTRQVHIEYQKARGARKVAELYATKTQKLFGEAAELPESLPKTFPDNTYPLRSLPSHLQAAISRDVRDKHRDKPLPLPPPLRGDLIREDPTVGDDDD